MFAENIRCTLIIEIRVLLKGIKLNRMELDEIDTPRDWPGHVREFLTLEQLLRCEICFKFFTNCMMTSCSHNFCSLCIRKHLSYKSTCPICFKETIEPALRSNRLIDEVVIAFSNARSKLIEMLQGTVGNQEVEQPLHRHTLKNEPVNICNSGIASSTLETTLPIGNSQTETKTKSVGLAKRPYLPKKVYNLMKEKEIKDCLRKAGLNLKGKREDLIQRYKQYVILYNAECDSENPRQVSELVKEIEDQEKLRLTLNNKSHKNFSTNHRSNLDDIEKEREQYVQSHSSQFQTLIDEIKHRKLDELEELEDEPEVMILPMPSTSKDSEPKICIELSSDSSDSESTSSDRTLCAPLSNSSSITEEITCLEDLDETFLFSSSDSTLTLPSLSRHTTDSDSDLMFPIGEISPVIKNEISSGANADDRNRVTTQNDHLQKGDIQALSANNKVVQDERLCNLQDQPGFHRKRKVTNMAPTIMPSDSNINPEFSGRRASLRKRNSPPLVSDTTKRNRSKKI